MKAYLPARLRETETLRHSWDVVLLKQAMRAVEVTTVFKHKHYLKISPETVGTALHCVLLEKESASLLFLLVHCNVTFSILLSLGRYRSYIYLFPHDWHCVWGGVQDLSLLIWGILSPSLFIDYGVLQVSVRHHYDLWCPSYLPPPFTHFKFLLHSISYFRVLPL